MVRKIRNKIIRSVAIDSELDRWFHKTCQEEGLSMSQVLNKRVREMKTSGVLW